MPAAPPSRPRRTPRGRRTEARLLAAAKELLVSGDGDMAHADVARRAGLSPGASYRYYPSKSQLMVAVVEAFFDEVEAKAYLPRFDEADDWWSGEQVRIQRLVDAFFDDPLGGVVARGMAGDAEVARALRRRVQRQTRGASRNVARGQAVGVVDPALDPDMAGALLMGGVYQAISMALARPMPERDALVAELTRFMARVLAIQEVPRG